MEFSKQYKNAVNRGTAYTLAVYVLYFWLSCFSFGAR